MSDPRTSRPQDLAPRTYPASMQVEMMVGKIHRATVTGADLDYVGSITVDADLLDAAGILPGQKIDVVDITGGARLSTYTIPGTRGSGEICINGAAAHHVHAGDLVILYKLKELPARVADQIDVLKKCAELTAEAMPRLRGMKNLDEYWVEINRLENQGDRVFRKLVSEILADGAEPINAITKSPRRRRWLP